MYIYSIAVQKYNKLMNNATLFLKIYKSWFIIVQLCGYLCTLQVEMPQRAT